MIIYLPTTTRIFKCIKPSYIKFIFSNKATCFIGFDRSLFYMSRFDHHHLELLKTGLPAHRRPSRLPWSSPRTPPWSSALPSSSTPGATLPPIWRRSYRRHRPRRRSGGPPSPHRRQTPFVLISTNSEKSMNPSPSASASLTMHCSSSLVQGWKGWPWWIQARSRRSFRRH